jgi:tetratricopeptide (TPR) repeat protein
VKRPAGWILPPALALLAALPSLRPGFIHDDHRIVEQNALVQDASQWGRIATSGYWTVDERQVPNLYRPVTIASLALNRRATGPGPFGFRLVDLALHLGVVGLFYAAARRLALVAGAPGADVAALVAAALFAVHPVHTEVLGLVVGRSELLAAGFTLLALVLFLGRSVPAGAAAIAALVLAFLSKESAVAAPVLLIAADRLARPSHAPDPHRLRWGFHAAAFTAVGLALLLRVRVLGAIVPSAFTHFIDNPIAHLPFPRGLFTALAVLWRDAWLLVRPWPLSIDYSYASLPEAASLLDPRALAGAALVLAWGAGLWFWWKRQPAAAWALLLLALPLLPVANLVFPIGTLLAERLLYLPSAGACLLAGLLAARFLNAPAAGRRRWVHAAVAAVVVVFALIDLRRFADWRDDRSIFRAAIDVFPDNVRAQFNYGAASERAGDDAAAEAAYRRAVAVWPRFSDAHYNLAGLLGRRNRWDQAVVEYHAAIEEQPGNVTYLVNAGHALTQAGQPAAGAELLERAVGIDRSSDRGWTDLGAAYLAAGRGADALRAWEEAARLLPDNPETIANRALGREAAGDFPGAAEDFERAATLRGGDAILRYRAGRAWERAGRADEAVAAYRESIRTAPGSPVPQKALGQLLLKRGDRAGARQALQRAAELDPGGKVMDAAALRTLEELRDPRRAPGSSGGPPAPGGSPGRRGARGAPRRRRARPGRTTGTAPRWRHGSGRRA